MRRRLGAIVAGGLAASVAGAAHAAPEDRPSIRWASDWEEAVEVASARNVPIFVTFHKDN